MSPEYGATCGFFPVDEQTLAYLRLTGRAPSASRSSRPTARRTCSGTTRRSSRRTRRSSSSTSATSSRVWPARAGLKTACRCAMRSPLSFRSSRASASPTKGKTRRSPRPFPRVTRPSGRRREPRSRARPLAGRGGGAATPPRRRPRHRLRDRARLGRDRSDHQLHEHVEPTGHGRRRAAREEGGREGPDAEALGEVEPRARLEGGDRVLRPGRTDRPARRARLPHRRLRLHDMHRELRPAARADLGGGCRGDLVVCSVLGQPELRSASTRR